MTHGHLKSRKSRSYLGLAINSRTTSKKMRAIALGGKVEPAYTSGAECTIDVVSASGGDPVPSAASHWKTPDQKRRSNPDHQCRVSERTAALMPETEPPKSCFGTNRCQPPGRVGQVRPIVPLPRLHRIQDRGCVHPPAGSVRRSAAFPIPFDGSKPADTCSRQTQTALSLSSCTYVCLVCSQCWRLLLATSQIAGLRRLSWVTFIVQAASASARLRDAFCRLCLDMSTR